MRRSAARTSYLEDSSDEDSPLHIASRLLNDGTSLPPPPQANHQIPPLALGRSQEAVSSPQPEKAAATPEKKTGGAAALLRGLRSGEVAKIIDQSEAEDKAKAEASQAAAPSAPRRISRRRISNSRPLAIESLVQPASPEVASAAAPPASPDRALVAAPPAPPNRASSGAPRTILNSDSDSSFAGSSSGDSLDSILRPAPGAAAAPVQRARRSSRLVDRRPAPDPDSQSIAANDSTSSVASRATPPSTSLPPRAPAKRSSSDCSENKTSEEQVQSLQLRFSALEEQIKQKEQMWSRQEQVREAVVQAERKMFEEEQKQLEILMYNRLQMVREDERGQLQREVISQVSRARNQLVQQGSELVASTQKLVQDNCHLEGKVLRQASELVESQRQFDELREAQASGFCPSCGNQYAPDAASCRKCGRRRTKAKDLSEHRAEFEKKMSKLRKSVSCTEQLLQEANARADDEQRQRKLLEEQLVQCEAKVEAKETARRSTHRQRQELEQQIAPLRKQVADLRFELQEARRRVDSPAVAANHQRTGTQDSSVSASALSIVDEVSKGLDDRPLDFHFDRLSLETMDRTLFKKEFVQCLHKLGASPAVLSSLTLKLRKGSVIARLEGAEATMRDLERLLQERQVAVMGDVARVVQATPGSVDFLEAFSPDIGEAPGEATELRTPSDSAEYSPFFPAISAEMLSGNDPWGQLKGCSPAQRLSFLAQGSSTVVAAILQKVQRLSDARLAIGGGGNAARSRPHTERLKVVKALEREIVMLERSNNEWASALVERGSASHEWAADLGLSRCPEEIAVSPSECTAKLPSELQQSARQLERLCVRLKAMHQ